MYNVIYVDEVGTESALASALDRPAATELARRVAAERQAGRIVCPGPVRPVNCVCVVPCAAPAPAGCSA